MTRFWTVSRILGAAVLAALIAATAMAMGRQMKAGPGGKGMESGKNLAAVDVTPNEWRGTFCAEERPSARIIESGAEWDRLWRDAIKQKTPEADFAKVVATAVFLGSKPTGGYGVAFLEPLSDGKEIVLRYRVRSPQGGMVIQAFTQPYAVKLYRKTGLKLSLAEVKD